MLEEFVDDPAERRWIEPRLAGLLGFAALPNESREELFSAWRTLFERIAARAPVIMVFTDLQWADSGLLDFIEDLLGWARSSPLLVIGLARPELLERRPDWGSTVRTVTRINLEPLSAGDMGALLAGLLPGLPDASLGTVCDRSEGIPLYAVETVRMLLDTGAVTEEDGHFRAQADLSQVAVPETLHALIAARLDANLPEDRALLQDASVIGQSFTADAAAAIAGADSGALTDRLDRLVRRQLLVREVDPRSPERGQYRFVQTLVRDVAYQSLAREDRRARHLAAARYLESLGEDELAGVLANHYLAAFRASRQGPEADALAAQARVSLQAAADRAAALQSHRQVIAYLEQALTVTDAPAERAATTERLVTASEPAGELSRGYDYATQARDLYREVGDGRGALRSVMWAARMLIPLQRADEAVTELEVAIRDAAPLGDTPELAAAYAELARPHDQRRPRSVGGGGQPGAAHPGRQHVVGHRGAHQQGHLAERDGQRDRGGGDAARRDPPGRPARPGGRRDAGAEQPLRLPLVREPARVGRHGRGGGAHGKPLRLPHVPPPVPPEPAGEELAPGSVGRLGSRGHGGPGGGEPHALLPVRLSRPAGHPRRHAG
jgi:tetratricopeptide (TPR) repeat protein